MKTFMGKGLAGTSLGVILIVTSIATLAALNGCKVNEKGDKGHEDVGIATPFGGLSVKTDDQAVQQGVGLAVYPGATLIKKDKGKNEAADVNLSFGSFHLGVKALSYQTPDAPARVMAFYKHDMARYGIVIDCRGHQPVGTPTRTAEGLTCDDDHGENVNINAEDEDSHGSNEELKAGSRQHMHVVGLEPQGSGTKIGLVALDLPDQINMKHHDDRDDEKQ